MNNKEKELQIKAAGLLSQMTQFANHAKFYYSSLNDVAKKFPEDVEGPENANATTTATCAASLAEVGNTFAQFRLKKYCIDPLTEYNERCRKTIKLSEDRHDALILMANSDESLEKEKAKGNQASITEKIEKNKVRHEAFQAADKAFREAHEADVKDSVIFANVWTAFTFYVEEMNAEAMKRFNQNIAGFNMAAHAGEFKSITDNTP